MFRVEGLVNLLEKQLPKEELFGAQTQLLTKKNRVKNQNKGAVPQSGLSRGSSQAKRKGNKIAESSNSVGSEEAQLARAAEVGSARKNEGPPRAELNNAGAVDLNETGSSAQQNGAEGAGLSLNGANGSAVGEGSGNGGSGQDGQDAADGEIFRF